MSTMSNQLPFDVPAQPDDRYRVQQIPGLALWVVWDTVKDGPVRNDGFPTLYRVESAAGDVANALNL